MNLEIRYTSLFGALNPAGFSVIRTTPAGSNWYVTVDDKTMQPIWEGEDRQECEDVARWNMQASDLAFVANHARDCDLVTRLYAGSDLTKSADGLNLTADQMFLGQIDVVTSDGFNATVKSFNQDWADWVRFRIHATAMEGTSGAETVILEFDVPVPTSGEDAATTESILVMLDFGQAFGGPYGTDGSVGLRFLNQRVQLDNEMTLRELLWKFRSSNMQVAAVLDQDDVDRELAFFKRDMPLYLASLEGNAGKREKVLVYEGGDTLEQLARMRPWMVESDPAGKPLPLRVEEHGAWREWRAGVEDDLEHGAQSLSSIVIRDKLTEISRKMVIAQQQAAGIELGQTFDDGRKFIKVASIYGADLEVLYDKTTPNTLGTRDWGCYRLWVEGELVLDVSPTDKLQYEARLASLAPGLRADWSSSEWTGEQVGELLGLALIGVGEGGDEESLDFKLPARVQNFLKSSFAEELRGAAQDLEEGTRARLEGGVFVEILEAQDEEDQTLSM